MTTRQRIGLSILAGSFWFYVLRGASALKMGLKEIHLAGIGAETATLEIVLYVRNPLLAQVFLRHVSGSVSVMGVPVGEINQAINKRIAARSYTYIPVQVQVGYANIGAAAFTNIMTGSVQSLVIDFFGKITAGEKVPVTVPVRRTWTYDDIIRKEEI